MFCNSKCFSKNSDLKANFFLPKAHEPHQVRGGVGSLGRIDSVEVPLFKQVEDGPELSFDRPWTERLVLDQLHNLRDHVKTWSEGFHTTSLQSTNLFGPLLETVGYEAAVSGDDHSIYVRRVDLVLLKVIVGAVELTRLALVITGLLKGPTISHA